MSNLDDLASPFIERGSDQGEGISLGFTKREHAAIALRVPESGDPDLDAMIRTAQRRDLAAMAMQGYRASLQSVDLAKEIASLSCDDADALLREIDRLQAEPDAAHDGEDALRSEVARLRAQVAALQCVELTDEELDAIYPEGRSLGTYHHELHRLLLRRVIAAGIKKSVIAGSAHRVPTPPQAAPGAALTERRERLKEFLATPLIRNNSNPFNLG